MVPSGDVAVVIPARNESDRIRATVTGAAGLPGVDLVLVVDDGSRDGTAAVAQDAGASVVRHSRSRGKAAAMESGAEAVRLLEARDHRPRPRHLLFLDADLGQTAGDAAPLTEPVRAGEADMTIAVFATRVKRGGHGIPDDKIDQRWKRSLELLPRFVRRASAFWVVDNSDSDPARPPAHE